eukprot:gene12718-4611_t
MFRLRPPPRPPWVRGKAGVNPVQTVDAANSAIKRAPATFRISARGRGRLKCPFCTQQPLIKGWRKHIKTQHLRLLPSGSQKCKCASGCAACIPDGITADDRSPDDAPVDAPSHDVSESAVVRFRAGEGKLSNEHIEEKF